MRAAVFFIVWMFFSQSAFAEEELKSIYLNPGSTFGTPIGYGAASKQGFIGIAATDGVGRQKKVDGSMVVGAGLGNPQHSVGLEVTASVISVFRHIGQSGTFNAKLHRWLPFYIGGAIGVENVASWGFAKTAVIKPNYYGVLTRVFVLDPAAAIHEKLLTVSLGVGNGRFQSKPYFITNRNAVVSNSQGVGVFGSVGWQFDSQLSLVSSWTGRDINAGISIVPFKNHPIVATVGAVDLLHKNQPVTRWVASVGYAFL